MMTENTPSEPLNCESVRIELPALLSDELDAATKRRVEEHLAACPTCRDEVEGHRRTLRHLKAWTAETATTELRRQPLPRRRPAAWLRPVMVGAAAAMLAFVIFGAVGAEAKWADGQLTLTLGRGGEAAARPDPAADALSTPAAAETLAELVDERIERLLGGLEEDLADLDRRHEQRRLILAGAVDRQRDSDWRRVKSAMEILSARQDAIANYVTEVAALEAPETLEDRKERS